MWSTHTKPSKAEVDLLGTGTVARMRARRIDDPDDFYESLLALVGSTESRHNRILGIAGNMARRPTAFPDRRLWVAEDRDSVVAAALWNPPFNLVITDASPEATTVLAEALVVSGAPIAGVHGNQPTVERFAATWSSLTGGTTEVSMPLGVFALDTVASVPTPPGRARVATGEDRPIIVEWIGAFEHEAIGDIATERRRIERMVDLNLSADFAEMGYVVWDLEGEPVSMSKHGSPTPNGIRIGQVYTPPDRRGRGYGTALVAWQSRELLAVGHQFCFLLTDLTNPTSNAIYERIGYRRVAEGAEIRFHEPPPSG